MQKCDAILIVPKREKNQDKTLCNPRLMQSQECFVFQFFPQILIRDPPIVTRKN